MRCVAAPKIRDLRANAWRFLFECDVEDVKALGGEDSLQRVFQSVAYSFEFRCGEILLDREVDVERGASAGVQHEIDGVPPFEHKLLSQVGVRKHRDHD